MVSFLGSAFGYLNGTTVKHPNSMSAASSQLLSYSSTYVLGEGSGMPTLVPKHYLPQPSPANIAGRGACKSFLGCPERLPIEVYLSYRDKFSINRLVAAVGRYMVLEGPTQVNLASDPGLGLIPPTRHSGERHPSALMAFTCWQGTEFRYNWQHEPISPALHGPQTRRNQHSVEAVLVTHQQVRAHSRCHDPFATNQLATIDYFSRSDFMHISATLQHLPT